MSFEYYTNWWIKSKKKYEQLVEKDELFQKQFKPVHDRNLANELIGGLYVKYCTVVQDLCTCVDQMVQPQKRISAKKIVDSACIRLNELNNELRKISLSEYHYMDGNLIELKLIPYDVEILHVHLFHHRPFDIEDLVQKIKRGERIYELPVPSEVPEALPVVEQLKREILPTKISEKLKISRPIIETSSSKENVDQLQRAESERQLLLLQTAERARQSRLYVSEVTEDVRRRKELQQIGIKQTNIELGSTEIRDVAALKIQKLWRGYRMRKRLRFDESKRRLLIGMNEPNWKSIEWQKILEENLQQRRFYRDNRMRNYIEAIDNERTRILRVVAPGLLEDIGDEIREWFHKWYVEAKTFDNYPTEEKGGTILVVRGETLTPKEYLDEYNRKLHEKDKKGKGKSAQKEKEKQKKMEEERKKKEAEKRRKTIAAAAAAAKKKMKKTTDIFELDELAESYAKPLRDIGEAEFRKLWNKRNDFDNPLEMHYMDLITEQKCYEVQLEVRKQVDELMRLELEILRVALAKDKGRKYKPKKQKKKKKKKKGKKKGKKDLTANRTTEDLFQELIDNGIIRPYPKASLSDFKGDFSYKNTELRANNFDPNAAMLDVRQAIALNCIQPLGVEVMNKPKSVLIVGPKQSGKHLLANAIFNHTLCVLFDLSPELTAGKYPGAKGLNMLIHLVVKMSKVLQPSVIFINGAERLFYKKVPKNEKHLEPKRIGKKIIKGIIKTIKPEDRVLVLGTSQAPWLARAAKLKKTFERNILIPRPDYGSVYLYWRELLRPFYGIDPDFNFTSLATVTINQSYSSIERVVKQVLIPRRIIQLKYSPLKVEEFYEVFIKDKIEPITDKEWKKYIKWYNKTPLGKERAQFNKWSEAQREQQAKQQEKARK